MKKIQHPKDKRNKNIVTFVCIDVLYMFKLKLGHQTKNMGEEKCSDEIKYNRLCDGNWSTSGENDQK